TVLATARLLAGTVDLVLVGAASARAVARARTAGVPRVRVAVPADAAARHRMLVSADLLLLAEPPDVSGTCVPQVLVDCLGAGRPVLAATPKDSAAAAELDRAGGAGLVVAPADPVTLAAAVRALHLDDGLRGAMGTAALRHARHRLDRDGAMSRLERILQAALAGTRRPA
ncbi:MAG TPA: hypothetical protein VI248_16200, partial [Kineosporiaceae bacterium]